jgi:hypothetical protein
VALAALYKQRADQRAPRPGLPQYFLGWTDMRFPGIPLSCYYNKNNTVFRRAVNALQPYEVLCTASSTRQASSTSAQPQVSKFKLGPAPRG